MKGMNKFQQFAYWWYKNVLGWLDDNVDGLSVVYPIGVLVLMFTLLILGAKYEIFWYIMTIIYLPPMLISMYSTMFADKCKFEDKIENDKREEKINNVLNN